MRPSSLLIACWTLAALAPLAAHAQAPPAPGSVFKEVINQPSGKNGYEELVLATEVLRTSKLWPKVEQGDATLSDKRLVLGDKPVIRVLALVKQAMAKPVFSPREALKPGELPPELNGLRSLGRLLAVQQYVFLSDGRISEAIGNARLGMRLGQVIQTDSLIGGLVGVAVGATTIRPLAAHLDQLSLRDCGQLRAVCEEWLNLPDPLPRVLAAERKVVLGNLAVLQKEAATAGAPADLYVATSKYISDYFDRQIADLAKPAWQRRVVSADDGPELARALIQTFAPAFQRTLDGYAREEANIRMLALHALILQHRWENDRVPASLAALNAGDLALDPFTGQVFQYEPAGRKYRLYSVGPLAANNDPEAVNGRKPVSVVPE